MGRSMIKFDIKTRFTGEIQFTAEIDCKGSETESVKIGLAVKWAIKNGASLDGASLVGASLVGARLVGARLDYASLDGASLDRASLDGASLDRARLDGASLDRASLVGASLVGASLDGASLDCARLDGALIRNGITLTGDRPVLFIGPIGSENGTLIAYNTDKGIYLQRGCFFGTLNEFQVAVEEKHGPNECGDQYRAAVALVAAMWDTA